MALELFKPCPQCEAREKEPKVNTSWKQIGGSEEIIYAGNCIMCGGKQIVMTGDGEHLREFLLKFLYNVTFK